MSMAKLLGTREAARVLGVTQARVRQLILGGLILAEKVGRDHLIDPAELKRFSSEDRRLPGRPKKTAKKHLR
jgi:excisionase family DNA binding protein